MSPKKSETICSSVLLFFQGIPTVSFIGHTHKNGNFFNSASFTHISSWRFFPCLACVYRLSLTSSCGFFSTSIQHFKCFLSSHTHTHPHTVQLYYHRPSPCTPLGPLVSTPAVSVLFFFLKKTEECSCPTMLM